MIEQHEREIDGVKYNVAMMPADQAIQVFVRLQRMLGAPMLQMLAGAWIAKSEEKVKAMAGLAATLFMTKLEEKEVLHTFREMCEHVTVVGVGPLDGELFNNHFQGALFKRLIPACEFIFEVNYQDFLEGAQSVIPRLLRLGHLKAMLEGLDGPKETSDADSSGDSPPPKTE